MVFSGVRFRAPYNAHLVALVAKAPGQDDFTIDKGGTCSVQRSGQFWPISPVGGSQVKELGGGEGSDILFSTNKAQIFVLTTMHNFIIYIIQNISILHPH